MVAFALSCFGILVFLWLNFGGSVPLKPKGYRLTVAFPEATQLAQEAEVRISGVPVGRVKKTEPNKQTGLTDTEIEIDEILRTLDPTTRQAFITWMDQQGVAAKGQAQAVNDALAQLTPFAEETDKD